MDTRCKLNDPAPAASLPEIPARAGAADVRLFIWTDIIMGMRSQ